MVNFDNAATTYPKPQSVIQAAQTGLVTYGGNPGRSGHALSISTADKIYETREKIAAMFGAFPENVAFTLNCTYALNMAIKGIVPPRGHVIISSLEHKSVARPAALIAKNGGKMELVEVSHDDSKTIEALSRRINKHTSAVIFTLGSNVTGQITPFRQIGELCKRNNVCFIADGAQAAGLIPINLREDGINVLCCPGHKGLYGPAGTGFIVTDGKYKIRSVIQGGTGSESLNLSQPTYMPDALESGTTNTSGNIALGTGIDYVKEIGIDDIFKHESILCEHLIDRLKKIPQIEVYNATNKVNRLPIVLFNIKGIPSSEVSLMLSDKGFAVRGGLHCSGLAHKSINTSPEGAVRFSPSIFNKVDEVDEFLNAIISIIP
jgi:cysteine desulfurase family protein